MTPAESEAERERKAGQPVWNSMENAANYAGKRGQGSRGWREETAPKLSMENDYSWARFPSPSAGKLGKAH